MPAPSKVWRELGRQLRVRGSTNPSPCPAREESARKLKRFQSTSPSPPSTLAPRSGFRAEKYCISAKRSSKKKKKTGKWLGRYRGEAIPLLAPLRSADSICRQIRPRLDGHKRFDQAECCSTLSPFPAIIVLWNEMCKARSSRASCRGLNHRVEQTAISGWTYTHHFYRHSCRVPIFSPS